MDNEIQSSTSASAPLTHTSDLAPKAEGTGVGRRMEWIDAMRGFTMLLVVAFHISLHGFGESPKSSVYLSSFVLFRMPLFFFISGFFSYSAKVVWNARTLGTLTLKKMRIQMLPTIIFFALYVVVSKPHFWQGCLAYLGDDMKGGYWFTYILLVMFMIYYLFAYVESFFLPRLKERGLEWVPIAAFWLVWLCIYATWFMPSWFKYPKDMFFEYSSFGQVIQYFHFFLAGNIVRRYWPQFQRLFDRKWFVPLVLTIATVCLCDFLKWKTLRLQWTNLPRTLAMYSLMTTVVLYFRHYAETFSKQTVIGRSLQYIGVRTLDIYLLHVLFIPHMPFVGTWLKSFGNPFVVDLLVSLVSGTIIVGLCIVASNIIRISPFLKYYLFGRK